MKDTFIASFLMLVSGLAIASESDVYDFSWLDSDKEVYVLQNRKYRKSGRLYLGAMFGKSLSSAFVDSMQGTLQGGFFFSENWGLELSYTKANGSENSTAAAVKVQGSVPFYRKVDTQMSAMLLWSPFYAKINTFNQIIYFDWFFGLGMASVNTLDNRNQFLPALSLSKDTLEKETVNGITWLTGWRFHLGQSLSLRVDFTALHLNADSATSATETKKRLDSKYNINLGINYAF